MKRFFPPVSATGLSTPIISDGGNQVAEEIESTPETETTVEMRPPHYTSSNPPAMSTRERNNHSIPADALGQFRKGDIEANPGLRKPIESLPSLMIFCFQCLEGVDSSFTVDEVM